MNRYLKKLIPIALVLILCAATIGTATASQQLGVPGVTELFFSEYIEGSSYNKALEIFNGTGAPIDMGANNYTIEIYFNDNTAPGNTISLSGTLADEDVFVVADDSANPAILAVADLPASGNFFNGNDAVALLKNGVIVDVIGQIGNDADWGSNVTLLRKETVTTGDTNESDAFDPTVEWDAYPVDTFDYLGVYGTAVGDTGQPLPLSEGFDDCALAGWEIVSVDADTLNTWSCSETYSNIDASGYGDSAPANEWLITPALNLDAQEGDTLNFRSYTKYTDSGIAYPQLQVLYSTDYDGGGDPTSASWTALSGITFSPEASSKWTDSGDVDLSGIGGTNVYFAFQYQSSGTSGGSAATWRLDGINFSKYVPPATPIYDIQYTDDPSGDSPFNGQADIIVEGIVTAVFYNGYFIEDAAGGPWSGLFVYNSNEPSIGDALRLTGTVSEYNGLTQLKSLTEYIVQSSGNPVPVPEILPTADVSQEQWESVLVKVENVTVTNEALGYGEWAVSDGSGDVIIDDKGDYFYTPQDGDVLVGLTGALDYTYGDFKIQPRFHNDIEFDPVACGTTFTPIYTIQGSGASTPLYGSSTVTEGIVVGDFQNNDSPDNGDLYGFHIQDPTGDGDPATSDGVFIYAPGSL